jgi:hypothetical protein
LSAVRNAQDAVSRCRLGSDPFPSNRPIRLNSEDRITRSFCQKDTEAMKVMLQKAFRWNHKSEAGKDRFLQRFELVRYRLLYLASYVICFFPIPLRFRDAGMLELAKTIKQIIFEHNLVIVVKQRLARK